MNVGPYTASTQWM